MARALQSKHRRLHPRRRDRKLRSPPVPLCFLRIVQFAVGWWIIIDSTCQYPTQADFNKLYYIIGSVGTVALIL